MLKNVGERIPPFFNASFELALCNEFMYKLGTFFFSRVLESWVLTIPRLLAESKKLTHHDQVILIKVLRQALTHLKGQNKDALYKQLQTYYIIILSKYFHNLPQSS